MAVGSLGSSSVSFVAAGTSLGTGGGALAAMVTANLTGGNTAHGVGALGALTFATQQTAQGYRALGSVTTSVADNPNTAVGWKASSALTTASATTAVGGGALQNNTASFNCALGEWAMTLAVTPNQCVAVGPFALWQAVSPGATTVVGYKAGQALGDATTGNTGIGNAVFFGNGVDRITGIGNFAGGSHTLRYITNASFNTIVGGDGGAEPGAPMITGSRNSGLGYKVFWGQTTQVDDAIGIGANTVVLSNYGIAIGSHVSAGAKVAAGHGGSVAIGVSSAGAAALTTAADQIRLGVAAHTVSVPGALSVTGSSTLAAVTATTVAGTNITASGTLGVTGATTMAGLTLSGVLKLPDGTGGAPSLVAASDATTGIYFAAGNEIRLATAGVLRARIGNGGLTLFSGNCVPTSGTTQDLGSSGSPWRALYLGGALTHAGTTAGLYGVAPVVRAAAITSPTAPSAVYVQAEAQAMKTAVDAIRVALTNIGVTS